MLREPAPWRACCSIRMVRRQASDIVARRAGSVSLLERIWKPVPSVDERRMAKESRTGVCRRRRFSVACLRGKKGRMLFHVAIATSVLGESFNQGNS